MKIKKIQLNTSTTKLIKLKLIKSKVYKHKEKGVTIENIETHLKKVLHLIYQYHKNKKKILFVGSATNLSPKIQSIFSKTRHIFLPDSIWINGIMTNQYSCFQYILCNQKTLSKKVTNLLFKLRNKSDLIVVLNASTASSQIFEGYKTKLPVVSLNSSLDILDSKITYKVPGNFHFHKKEIKTNLFYSILASIFKKASMSRVSQSTSLAKRKKNGRTSNSRNSKTFSRKK